MMPEKLSVLVTYEVLSKPNAPSEIWWGAQIIEQDLATQARTLAELMPEVQRLVIAYVCTSAGPQPWQGPAAPVHLRDLFEAAPIKIEWLPDEQTTPGIRIPALEFRYSA